MKNIEQSFNRIKNVAQKTFLAVSVAIGGAIFSMMKYEKSLKNVLTLLSRDDIRIFSKDLDAASKSAIKLGFSIDDTNKGLFDTVSAIGDISQSLKIFKESQILAKAGVTQLSVAVDGLTSVINAYGKETTSTRTVSNAFFSAQRAGKTTVALLAANVGKLAPVARQAGIGFQELLATASQLTLVGLSTEEATTALRAAISSLLKPAAEAESILRKYNVPIGASELKTRGFRKALQNLAIAAKENPDAIAQMIPNIRALTAIGSLGAKELKNLDSIIKQMHDDVKNGTGLLEAYNEQIDSSQQSFDEMKGSITVLLITLGEKLAPLFKKITGLIKTLSDFVSQNPAFANMIATFLVLAATLSGVVLILGPLIIGIIALGAKFAIVSSTVTILIGSMIWLKNKFIEWFGEIVKTDEVLNGEEGLFPQAKIGAESLVEGLQTVKEKMEEVQEAGILLGTALRAGLGVGGIDLGTIPDDGGGDGGGESSHPFTEGFASGLEDIKKKIKDISQLGKDMALTLHSSFSTAISNMILGISSAKEAFAAFGKTMLEAIVKFIAEWITFQILSKVQALVAQAFAVSIAATLATAWAPAAALASLATLGSNAQPAAAALIGTTALAHFLAIPKFAEGSAGMKDDTIGLFSKREIVIPATFSDAIRSGDLSLSGGGGQQGSAQGGNIVMDFSNTTFNGVTREFVEDIFRKAGESIKGRTLVFAGA